MRRVLICRGGALGDFVVTLPVLRALRRAWPGARLDLLGYPRHAALAVTGRLADGVRSLDDAGIAAWFDAAAPDLPPDERRYLDAYDGVVCFLHDPDGIIRGKLARVLGDRLVWRSPLPAFGHVAEHLLGALPALGLAPDDAVPRLELPGPVREAGDRRLRALGERVAVLHPGSGSPRKNWPAARYASLALCLRERWGLIPAVVLGEVEQGIEAALPTGLPRLAGLTAVELAGVLRGATLYVGNDSGATHLAAAVRTGPTVALFGPTDPAVWAPRGQHVTTIRAEPPTTEGLASLPLSTVEEAISRVYGA